MTEHPVNPVTGRPRPAAVSLGQAMGWLLVAGSASVAAGLHRRLLVLRQPDRPRLRRLGRPRRSGCLLLPWTTFAYAIDVGRLVAPASSALEWLVVAAALLLDLGTYALARHLWRARAAAAGASRSTPQGLDVVDDGARGSVVVRVVVGVVGVAASWSASTR